MTIQKILVPDMGDFKDVEVIEVLVKKGQDIKKNESLITWPFLTRTSMTSTSLKSPISGTKIFWIVIL